MLLKKTTVVSGNVLTAQALTPLRTGQISKAVERLLKRYQEKKAVFFLHTFFTKGTYKQHINIVIYKCSKGEQERTAQTSQGGQRTKRKEKTK